MKKKFILAALCCLLFTPSFAKAPIEILLWPEGVPESNGITEPEINKEERFSNISIPMMTVYLADSAKNTGASVVLCPGGGYGAENARHEGREFAQWLSENGITGIVLKYRLPNKNAFIPLKDAQQAMRIIRSKAIEWNINTNKVGISGFSAGGHLASTAGTHFDLGKPVIGMEDTGTKNKKKTEPKPAPLSSYSCRPDFMILFYPVITMKESITDQGSRNSLIGPKYNKDSVYYYSNELQVTSQTPPTLLFFSDNDKLNTQNSIIFYTALKEKGVPATMYIFPDGGHGWGFKTTFSYHETWKALYLDWLKQQKIID